MRRTRRSTGRRPGRPRLRAGLAGLGTLVVVGGLLIAGARGGFPATRPQLLSGAAWLASAQVGQLTLLDGASAEVAAQVRVADKGERLDVVQRQATGYSINHRTGMVRRVDGATFEVSPPTAPIPQAGDGLAAFAGTDTLYALDSQRGVLASADPVTLATRGPTVPLAAQVSPEAAALDESGRLWVLDTSNGDLVWIDHGQRHVRRGVAQAGGGRLVLADGAPVVVDPATHRATVFDPGSGEPRTTIDLDLRAGDRIEVSGSPHSSRLYLVAARGVLAICDLGATSCATALPLGSGTGDLGPPVETGGRLFVPDYTTGQVWVVDLEKSWVLARPKVLDAHTHFQLLTRDGVVFFNDPNSERAGVIRLDGGIKAVRKYDPKDPNKGLTGQPGDEPTPDSTNGLDQLDPQPKPTDSTPPPKPGDPPGVKIAVSKSTAQVGEDITLKAVPTGRAAPTALRWSFGDGQNATGPQPVTHHWDSAQTFNVSVRATFPDGKIATAYQQIRITTRQSRLTVTVSAGGTVTGPGLSCPPTCATSTPAGQPVTLTAKATQAGFVLQGWGGACAGTSSTCTVTMNGDRSVSATFGPPTPVVLPAPVLLKPANGAVLFNYPRNTTVTWQAVPGAAKYHMESQYNGGSWTSMSDQTVTGTSASFTFIGDNPGRWRVTAIAPDGTPGTTSGWRTFSYDTRIQAFAGNWVRSGGNIVRATFQATSRTGGTLHLYGNCSPSPCDWGTTSATLQSDGSLRAFYNCGCGAGVPFKTVNVRITISGGKMVVQTHNHFIDNSGRPDYDSTDTLSPG
jgi:hypothetical protein